MRHPKFKSRRKHCKFYQDTAKIKITSTHVKLEKLAEADRIPLGVSYKQPRISFDGINWWLSVSVEYENQNKMRQ